ncbi:DUF3987 domain-containing protein [Actinomadura sp. HBU206391]|uniref:DUF3987 domain-containing protein n=1 Tax=Actinomadura sp. HBU206391 TaxID=2731692 RepID=UPI0016502A74|nr:DUF3987 domain-containing protein [Actinomadura sp. HBU206391]MBC6461472.1 DUF3987 domain-containing protein [Actinomadura sp. HBU206391]
MTKPSPLRLIADDQADDFTRAMPHNIEAEQCVLGAVMLSPRALDEVRELLDGSEFYRPAHSRVWQAITALADRDAPCDPLAVGAEIGTRDLAKAGGAPYLHTLITTVPTTTNATYYAHMLRDLAYARQVIETGTRLVQLGHEHADDSATSNLRALVTAQATTLTTADTRGWPDPTPLSATPELPEFPIYALPPWVGEYAAGLAEITQTPPDLAGCLALAVLAVAAGGNVWVNAGAWSEPTNLFTLIVLPPGNRKSEVYKAMTAPIKTAEKLLIEQAQPRIAEAIISRRIAEADAERTEKAATETTDVIRQAEALTEAADARMRLDAATVPAEPSLFSDDATVERLTSHLAEQNGRFAVLSPEGEIFSIAAGRYSGAPNFAVLKSGHAGEEMRIDRMGRPAERIDAATITLGICTQPGVLTRLGETPQFREQGLLGRLLYSVPKSLLGYRKERPEPIAEAVSRIYTANLTALVLSLHDLNDTTGAESGPANLTFTPDAQDAIVELLAATEPRFRPGTGDLAHMTDWGGKLVGAVVRIAALLHLAEHLRDGWYRPVDLATFANAQIIGEYFVAHAQAAYDTIGADPAVADARALLDWARNTATNRFTARDVMRSLKHRFAKVTDLDPGLRVLESHGWVRRIPAPPTNGRGRPAAPAYELHPNTAEAGR